MVKSLHRRRLSVPSTFSAPSSTFSANSYTVVDVLLKCCTVIDFRGRVATNVAQPFIFGAGWPQMLYCRRGQTCCTIVDFRGRVAPNAVLSPMFGAGWRQMLYCRRLAVPGGAKCRTHFYFRGLVTPDAVLSSIFGAGWAQLLYCR